MRWVAVVGLVLFASCKKSDESRVEPPAPSPATVQKSDAPSPPTVDALLAQREKAARTLWAGESKAQQYEAELVRLWDALNATDRKLSVLAELKIDTLTLGKVASSQALDHGIQTTRFVGGGEKLGRSRWVNWLQQLTDGGWRLIQSEWHHEAFDPAKVQSKVRVVLHLTSGDERAIVRGIVRVGWSKEKTPASVAVEEFDVLRRKGGAVFEEILTVGPTALQAVIAQDLNNDGLSELLFVGNNSVYWNRGDGRFEPDKLVAHPRQFFEVAVVADMSGDGIRDLSAIDRKTRSFLLYHGDRDGRFLSEPHPGKAPLVKPQMFTVGDIDADGDLDAFVGQYKTPYVLGQMPSPYFDANDGFPAMLIFNHGNGVFKDDTEARGLGKKRFRRTYSGSFVDLDDDGDLDLAVVSDFSGIDLYANDGTGTFTDMTSQWLGEWHNFGMSITFADYNLDGALDFYVSGMASSTARRIEAMKLKSDPMRSIMGYGNRMYLANGKRFVEPDFKDQVARTGWAWGSSSFDFDNDGDSDIFVGNGHSSGESTKDYCTHFWTQDIYNDGNEDPVRDRMYRQVLDGYIRRATSWDGYQKNVLLMNRGGRGFVNVAFLMGVGAEYDARAVLTDDLNADGQVDLIVLSEKKDGSQTAHVYLNRLKTSHHWIGVRLGADGIGAKVTAVSAGRRFIKHIVTGDSFLAQHANVAHFGLGTRTSVDSIEVRWPGGHTRRLVNPALDQYHRVIR